MPDKKKPTVKKSADKKTAGRPIKAGQGKAEKAIKTADKAPPSSGVKVNKKASSAKTKKASKSSKKATSNKKSPRLKAKGLSKADKKKPNLLSAESKATKTSKKEDKKQKEHEKKWEGLHKKAEGVKAPLFRISHSFSAKAPLKHPVFGWGWVVSNNNNRLQVMFKDKIRMLLSNYGSDHKVSEHK